ncbi:MAG: hypothetical protein PHP85_12030 [Gallionella sp.]|nr:hypothetical protein [Gallionella sp.]
MNEKIIFIRTIKGDDEARSRTALLSKDIKRALLMVDGTATVGEIMKRSSPSLRDMLEDMFTDLVRGGYIRDKSKAGATLIVPPKPVISPKKSSSEVDELDFTAAYRLPTAAMLAEEAAKVDLADKAAAQTEALAATEKKNKLQAEAARRQADEAAERQRVEAAAVEKVKMEARLAAVEKARLEAAAEKAKMEARLAAVEKAKQEAAEKAMQEARAEKERQEALAEKARQEAVAAQKARQEAQAEKERQEALAEKARQEAAAAAEKTRQEARAEKERQEALAEKARQEAAAAQKAMQEAQAEKERQEALAEKARQEAAAAAEKTRQEARAEKERQEALAEKARQEAAAAQKAMQEARAEKERQEALAEKARQEAAAVQKAMQEARAEKERQEALAEKARQEAAAAAEKTRQEAQAEKERQEALAEKARQEAAAAQKAMQEAQAEKERQEARAEKERQEARAAAIEKSRLEARARVAEQAALAAARAEAERLALEAQEARKKAEQEAARAEAEARVRAEVERQAREAAETARLVAQHAAEVKAAALAAAEQKAALEAEVQRLKLQAEQEAHARAESEKQAKLNADAARLEAEQRAREAQDARVKAEQEAVLAKAEAEERVRVQSERQASEIKEVARKAAQYATEAEELARAAAQEKEALEIEVAKLKTQAETSERAEAAARAKREGERIAKETAARLSKEEEAARVQAAEKDAAADDIHLFDPDELMPHETYEAQTNSAMLAAVVRLNAKHAAVEESVFSAMEVSTKEPDGSAVSAGETGQWLSPGLSDSAPEKFKSAPMMVAADGRSSGEPVVERRTTTAAVLFFDIVGYTKKSDSRQIELKHEFNQLVSDSLDQLGTGERIILDTGDGIAIGFLQHPTDALQTAMLFRNRQMLNKHGDYPDLRARLGIHLGPVSLVKDLNGQINMLGDGINSAQRVMSFAGKDQIYVSRAYFDFVSNLSDEYNDLFRYRGSHQDKHGREFQVYELLDASGSVGQAVPTEDKQTESTDKLDPFSLDAFDAVLSHPRADEAPPRVEVAPKSPEPIKVEAVDQFVVDAAELGLQKDSGSVAQTEAPAPPAGASLDMLAHTHEYSQDEARILADEQARKWAEAELRAAENARKKAESTNQQIFHPADEGAPAKKPDAKSPRKSIPWFKMGAGLFVLLLAALFVVPIVIPKKTYLANIEKLLGARLQQPVHIGQLSGRILPMPRLVLSDVYIGDAKQIEAKQARVNFSFAALFGKVKSISTLELDGMQVTGSALPQVALWMQQVAEDHKYPVARIVWAKGILDAEGVSFSDVGGELDFDRAGKFTQAHLSAEGHKIAMDIQSVKDDKLQLDITLADSALPLFPNWVFEELKATGELTRDELHLADMEGRIMGGVLTGDARINWRSGWRVQGALVAHVVPLQSINKLLSGDLEGSAHFQMQSDLLANLAAEAKLNGVFSIKKGVIGGVDIVETTRLRSRENLPGGRTYFDDLSGELDYAHDIYQFKQLKINNSVANAAGSMTIVGQKLSGSVSSSLTMRAGMGSAVLQIGGTSDAPTLQVAQ